MADVSVFILAGGRSSRMGRDKALLPFNDATLLEFMVEKARALTSRVFIVGGRELYSGYGAVIEDIVPGCGPLGGIHAALASSESNDNLILSVDIPFVTTSFLGWLLSAATNADAQATVPQAGGRLQPLCAMYRRDAVCPIEEELRAGHYKVAGVFSRLTTRIVPESQLLAAGFDAEMFRNLNTPAEYNAVTGRDAEATSIVKEHH